MQYTIVGMFWVNILTPDNLDQNAIKYFGTIEMKEDGTFQGLIYDRWGVADVVGKMDGSKEMSWVKTYNPTYDSTYDYFKQSFINIEKINRPKYPCHFSFNNNGHGWVGTLKFNEEEKIDPNLLFNATCVMFPS